MRIFFSLVVAVVGMNEAIYSLVSSRKMVGINQAFVFSYPTPRKGRNDESVSGS